DFPDEPFTPIRFGDDAGHLQEGVVRGIGFYGNAIGVPTVGGELAYGAPYRGNPLVNVLCVGIRRPGSGISARTSQPGDRIILVGADTGRDGIHGASLLASRSFAHEEEQTGSLRPAVQVGDPFTGKMVMEGLLAALATERVHAVQDLGAAGLSSALAEMASQGEVGMRVEIERVPRREEGMTAYEVMLSETQERMLLTAAPDDIPQLLALLSRLEVQACDIGEVTHDGRLTVRERELLLAEIPASILTDGAPRREAPAAPDAAPAAQAYAPAGRLTREEGLRVLAHRECQSKAPVYHRYDYMIQTHTVKGPGSDAAVLRLDDGRDGLVIAVDGPGRYAAGNARAGGARAVLEAVVNVTAEGGEVLGLSDGLNLGSPDDPAVYHDFVSLVAGIAEASRELDVPVTGGNVSFYNQTGEAAVWPTAVIAAVGRHPDPAAALDFGRLHAGQSLYLLGEPEATLGATIWRLQEGDGTVGPTAMPDWSVARAVLAALSSGQARKVVSAAHDVADGGLFVALAEMWLAQEDPGLGLHVTADSRLSARVALFNEGPCQIVVAVDAALEHAWDEVLQGAGAPARRLGSVCTDASLTIDTTDGTFIYGRDELQHAYMPAEPLLWGGMDDE
ncbi:MAG: AIR synthase-related protein, partial [Clostridia bacterium]